MAIDKDGIMEDVEEYLDDIAEDAEDGILVPLKVVEALLVASDMGNRTATVDVVQQIREIAISQGYEKF